MDQSTFLPNRPGTLGTSVIRTSDTLASRRPRNRDDRLSQSKYSASSSGHHNRSHSRRQDPSISFPDSLKPGPDKETDYASATGAQARMNQSMFSLLAAAGTQHDFQPRFGDESSGSDTEKEEPKKVSKDSHSRTSGGRTEEVDGPKRRERTNAPGKKNHPQSPDVSSKVDEEDANTQVSARTSQKIKHDKVTLGQGTPAGLEYATRSDLDKRKGATGGPVSQDKQSKLQGSLPKIRSTSHRERSYMSQSMILPPRATQERRSVTPRDSPVLRRMMSDESEANEEEEMQARGSADSSSNQKDPKSIGTLTQDAGPKLAMRLKEIFDLQEPEEVISEYPCWLLQSVLLQGYLYITAKHFCFYAYLPKRSNAMIKSGSLMKKVKRGPRYVRQWFVLKGDILTYYDNPSSLYFQAGHVDLRYGISASVVEQKDQTKEARDFTVVTQNRTYFFRADSGPSAKEWVKALQRVIFRTHNDGDSVKIALPVENVIDIEDSPVIEFAKTIKIRVIDNDETFAIDEYFFSFFSFGEDAKCIMQSLVPKLSKLGAGDGLSPAMASPSSPTKQRIHQRNISAASGGAFEAVKNTLSPILPPVVGRGRSGSDSASSTGGNSRAVSASRPRAQSSIDLAGQSSPSLKPSEPASESFVESGMASSGPNFSSDDFQSSASQVLSRSDIFRRPRVDESSQSFDATANDEDDQAENTADGPPEKQKRGTPSRAATPKIPDRSVQESTALTATDMEMSTPSLRKLVVAGQYPLKRAVGIAGYIHRNTKDMSALLATKSMGYAEKISGMWAGGKQYYYPGSEHPDGSASRGDSEGDHFEAGQRFRAHFGLPDSERLLATYFGHLHRVLPLYGKIYIGETTLCFRSLLPGTKTKIIIPMRDIETVDKETGFSLGYHGLVIVIQGFEELFFEFVSRELRDDCAIFLLRRLDSVKYDADAEDSSAAEEEDAAEAEHKALTEARQDNRTAHEIRLPDIEKNLEAEGGPTIIFDDPRASILNFKPTDSLKITCLTIGSRGDVQPYIALCKGLMEEGHKPKIATHREFEGWVRSHGIDFAPVEGDPAELMRICVENGMFTPSFFKEATSKFRGWIDELLSSAWTACQGSDLLVESPSAMAGIHIAEALKIPYFRAFTMPWTRTRAYPHAFAVPEHRMGGAYNKMTYVMFDNVFWAAISGQVNRWRKRELSLPSTTLDKLHPNKVPFLYNFSPSVVAPPLDFPDWIRITGYWYLDEGNGYQPDAKLASFIKQARDDGKKLVYIGFGSIVVSDPVALTRSVVESVEKADVRCILSKGWSDRLGKKDESNKVEVALPPSIHQIKSCPHDWLFRQVDCVVHHGGAGTTGAGLRAGVPTIIKPFFGDQFFFGTRIEDLGVGVCLKKLNVSLLSRALWQATRSERMIVKARVLGEHIRDEDGVATAIQAIYRDMEYAKSLIKNRDTAADPGDLGDDDEESWTFVEDDSDPELAGRAAQWDQVRQRGDNEQSEMRSTSHSKAGTLSINNAIKLVKRTGQSDRPRSTDARAAGVKP